jgi:hypothetical protein
VLSALKKVSQLLSDRLLDTGMDDFSATLFVPIG